MRHLKSLLSATRPLAIALVGGSLCSFLLAPTAALAQVVASDNPFAGDEPATAAEPDLAPVPALQGGPTFGSPPTAVKNPDGTYTFDPSDPALLHTEMLMRQRRWGESDQRTLPDWCYATPPFDPNIPRPPVELPCGDAGGFDERVAQPVRWWTRLSYLSMWADGYGVPALVTTSPAGTPQADAGVLPAATVLFGNEQIDDGQRNGGEVKIGYWLVDGQFMAIEGDYWALANEATRFSASESFQNDPSASILARPFFNLTTMQQDAAVLAFPNFVRPGATVDLDGTVDIESQSAMQSAGLTFRHILWGDFEREMRLDLFGGYRFMQVDESLLIHDSFFDPGGGLIGPTLRESTDIFDVRNDFHGGEVGMSLEMFRNRWAFEVMAKVGLGNNHQVVTIDGNTQISSLGTTAIEPGGLLALPTNIGRYTRDTFMAIPEGSVTARYSLRENLELGVGFRILYLDDVARPGQQIDTTINETQIGGTLVGEARPTHVFRSTDMLLRGIDVSLEYRW
ncbi:MAG: BBP7 family outer membrane beta-barrel protein [Pirellulales bacterium]